MEMLDVVDEYGNPTGGMVERHIAHQEGIMHRTSHVWVLRKKNEKVQILLQKRCSSKDSFPGFYDTSSAGHIPAGCGFSKSALRELKEELGVNAVEEELIFCGDRKDSWDDTFHGIPYHDRQYSRVFCLWKDLEEDDFTVQPEEVESVRWFDFDKCLQAVRNNTIKHCIYLDELQMVEAAINNR